MKYTEMWLAEQFLLEICSFWRLQKKKKEDIVQKTDLINDTIWTRVISDITSVTERAGFSLLCQLPPLGKLRFFTRYTSWTDLT